MKILAINGSHRAGQNTAFLLNLALEEGKARGAETELIELSELNSNTAMDAIAALASLSAPYPMIWTS